ncbi:MAG: glycosyltransferase family 4 protein, partial [Acidimicrobiia bacterium]
ALHQFLPDFNAGDAIGDHVLRIRATLREAGYDSEIYADDIKPAVAHLARHYREFDPARGEDTWLLYHLSTGSPMADWVADASVPMAVDYHNITPARYFGRWMPDAAERSRAAREEMRRLAPHSRFALADSAYNAEELTAEGYQDVSVLPILIDFTDYDAPPDPRAGARLERLAAGGGARWLFVGRFVSNKGQHDLIAAFAAYRRLFDPRARLAIVGHWTLGRYVADLERMADDLGVAGAVELPGAVPFPELVAEYRAADVYVSLSEHEGFCVPVLEAMHFGVPVVALARGAVPATVGNGGLLLETKEPLAVAAAVHRVLTETPRRERLLAAGRGRVAHFSLENNRRRLLDAVGPRVGAVA